MIVLRVINACVIIAISTTRIANPLLNKSQDWIPYVSIIVMIVTLFQDVILYGLYYKLLFWFYVKKRNKLQS